MKKQIILHTELAFQKENACHKIQNGESEIHVPLWSTLEAKTIDHICDFSARVSRY